MAESFGNRMHEIRKKKRVTLRKLSDYVGMSISYLSDIEHDRKRPPELEIVKKIEEFLAVDSGALISLASQIRKKVPQEFTKRMSMMPKLSEVLLRADEDLTADQFEQLMDHIEELQGKKGK